MKSKFFLLLFICMSVTSLWAQDPVSKEKTVLFLIPFYTEQYNEQAVANIKTSEDIASIYSFQLMGFWEGAQMALDEYDTINRPLKVIVKDVTDNETKLRAIMNDKALMQHVDLIIGPFFSKMFAIAAKYAKEYKIPIVNPFTNRTDLLANNEYVYKLMPAADARPAMVSFIADQYPHHQILIWADSTKKTKDFNAYLHYFHQHKIPFKVISPKTNILTELKTDTKNILLPLYNDGAQIMMLSRNLILKADLKNLLVIAPEEWLNLQTYDVDYYSKLNLHFFSDYYINFSDDATMNYVAKFTEKYKIPPTLENYAFQGYDITRYFIELLYNNMDVDLVKIDPLAYHFSFDKVPQGGYENVNIQCLQIKDNEIQRAEY